MRWKDFFWSIRVPVRLASWIPIPVILLQVAFTAGATSLPRDTFISKGKVFTDTNSRVVGWATSNMNSSVQTIGYWDRRGKREKGNSYRNLRNHLTFQGDYYDLWQRRVERGLVAGKQTKVQIYNFGENGAASDAGLTYLYVALLTRPEVVVLELKYERRLHATWHFGRSVTGQSPQHDWPAPRK